MHSEKIVDDGLPTYRLLEFIEGYDEFPLKNVRIDFSLKKPYDLVTLFIRAFYCLFLAEKWEIKN